MKHSDAQHCSSDLVANMKHSLRLRSGLLVLLLVAVGTILCCRAAVRCTDLAAHSLQLFEEEEEGAAAASAASTPVNATLLRLASVDAGEEFLRRELERLVDGSFAGGDPLYRSFASWRRFHHHSEQAEIHLERRTLPNSVVRDIPSRLLRSPRDYQVFPEFRRLARDWLRRRRFHPDVMSQLVDLVKRPIELHNAGLRPDEGNSSSAGDAPVRRYGSCAVVGNSGILLQSEHGNLIDGHDLVIRLNNARTVGYERNVGSKTDLAFINSNILHLCARRETCFCHPYGEHVPIIMYICQAAHFLDFTVCNASHKAPLLVTDPRFDLLCARTVKYYSLKRFVEETGKPPEEWGSAHDAKMFHYSSGMQAVVLALGICDRVNIFGFGKSAEAKHHYHTNQKAELSLHDYEAEYAFYRDLMERPQVISVLMESGFRVPPVVMYH